MPPLEPEPSPAVAEREREVEHRTELRIERRHVLGGLLRIATQTLNLSAAARAWTEIGKLEAMYPDKNVHHTVEELTAEDEASLDRLVARFERSRMAVEPTGNGATRGAG